MSDLDKFVANLTPAIIKWRRHVHAHPELGLEEYETAAFIETTLGEAGISSQNRVARTGVVANLAGKGKKTIAIRADIDALPLLEETGLPFASSNGAMHACGHDAHIAIVLGVAHLLSRLDNLPGNVKFIFQPCEERLPGGAKSMIAEGVLERPKVDAMLGLHVYQYLPTGVVGLKNGAIMAATDIFTVQVEGKGGHGAAPHTTVDPIVTAAQIITALQTIVSRKINPVEPAVVTIGTIHAGERPNIIPSKATLSGTVRSLSPDTREFISSEIRRIVASTAEAAGATAKLNYELGHGPLINDAQLTAFVRDTLVKEYGNKVVRTLDSPSMAGEDFAAFAERVPANYMFFGAAQKGKVYPWHHPCFDIDENVLPFAVKVITTLILKYLQNEDEIS